MPSVYPVVYRFGTFELDVNSGELRKNGIKQKLQDQTFQVLITLLDRTGETVTREELQHALWPADTFVSFETGLNTAIKRLREVLSDSADAPIFIETLPRRGYRFVSAVNKVELHKPDGNEATKADARAYETVSPGANGYVADRSAIGENGVARVGNFAGSALTDPRIKPRAGLTKYVIGAMVLLFLAIGLGLGLGKFYWLTPPPLFHRLSFQRGYIPAARFGVDSKTVIYSAAWDGKPPELFSTRTDSPESRKLGLGAASILAISSSGQMAIAKAPMRFGIVMNYKGTLAQAPLAGGASRELLEDVIAADWDTTGTQIALVRMVGGRCQLEFPLGKALYVSSGFISNMRISRDQKLIAFLEHQHWEDDLGAVVVVDTAGKERLRTKVWETVNGLAWSAGENEVWFTAAMAGSATNLYGVSLTGRQRVIERIGTRLVLQDISPDGRVLITEEDERFGIKGMSSDEPRERDLSFLDYSFLLGEFSSDGKTVVFAEEGEASGPNYAACLRKWDESPPVRLGEGVPTGVSSDGKWVLSARPNIIGLILLPTGPGQMKELESHGVGQYWGTWFPDGQHIMVQAHTPGGRGRSYIESVDGKEFRTLTPEGVHGRLISADGKEVIGTGDEINFSIYPVDGGKPRPVPGMQEGYEPIQWSTDGRTLYVRHGTSTAELYRVELATGKRTYWKTIEPVDPAGLLAIDTVDITRDGTRMVYGFARITSELQVVDGLR